MARKLTVVRPHQFDREPVVDPPENNMPTCAMHPSQPSQFDSQPLSQHALSQTSELSFGGGAALHSASASMAAMHSAKAEAASSMNGSFSHDNPLNASERQEDPDDDDDDDDGDDSQAPLKVCQLCLCCRNVGWEVLNQCMLNGLVP